MALFKNSLTDYKTNEEVLQGEKPKNWLVSKNNTAAELPAADPAGNNGEKLKHQRHST